MTRPSIRITASLLMSLTLLLPSGSVAAHDTSYCAHADKWDYGSSYGYNTYVDYNFHYTNASGQHVHQYTHHVYDWYYNYLSKHIETNVCG